MSRFWTTFSLAPFLVVLWGIYFSALAEYPSSRIHKSKIAVSAFERIQLTSNYQKDSINSYIVKNVDFGRNSESHLLVKFEVKSSDQSAPVKIDLKFDDAKGPPQFLPLLNRLDETKNTSTGIFEVSLSDPIPRREGLHDLYLSLAPDSTPVEVISLQFTPYSVFTPYSDQWYYVISEHNARAWRLTKEDFLHTYHLNSKYQDLHVFRFEKVWESESYYRIKSKFYSKFLEVKDASRTDQTVLIQANSSNEEKQIWLLEGRGNEIRLHPQFSIERCLGVITASQTDGNGVYLNACDRSVQQLWSIIPACMD